MVAIMACIQLKVLSKINLYTVYLCVYILRTREKTIIMLPTVCCGSIPSLSSDAVLSFQGLLYDKLLMFINIKIFLSIVA